MNTIQLIKLSTLISFIIGGTLYCDISFATFDNTSSIDNSFSQDSGIINANINSGDLNLQTNDTAISINPNGSSTAQTFTIQRQALNSQNSAFNSQNDSVAIGANSFSNDSGLISVNQVAGSGNSQANQVSIAVGETTHASDGILDATSSSNSSSSSPTNNSGIESVSVDSTAFAGTTGVVQLNQVAGIGNMAANTFNLRVSP